MPHALRSQRRDSREDHLPYRPDRPQGCLAHDRQDLSAGQLRAVLDDYQIAGRPRFHVELVFEEIVTNVIRHGYHNDAARSVDVLLTISDDAVEMAIEDDGVAFDPLERPDPTLPTSLEAAPLGGLGILLARKMSRSLHYERTADGRNRLVAVVDR